MAMSYDNDDDDRPDTESSKISADIFQEDANIPGILRSLIDQQKLQNAWGRIGKRLKLVETNLTQAEQKLGQLSSEYVSKPAYQELVEEKHGRLLGDHSKALEQLNALTSRLSNSFFEDSSKLSQCLDRLQKNEEQQVQVRSDVEKNTKLFQAFREEIKDRLDDAEKKFQAHVLQNASEHEKISEREQADMDKLWADLKKQEARMQEFTEKRVTEAVKHALDFEKGSKEQIKLIEMVDRELVDALRVDLKKSYDRLTKHMGESEQQKFDILRQIRSVEQKATETSTTLGTHKKETKEDLEKRPYTKDVQTMEASVRKDISHLNSICEGLQTRTILKLNEFVDHVGKLHETIDDHEHCLRHHAEEMENRSTKYDLLLCQSQIDKCVGQDEYSVELQEMKKVLSWQTNKIENLGLGMPSGKSKLGAHNVPGKRRHASRASVSSRLSTMNSSRTKDLNRSMSTDRLSEASLETEGVGSHSVALSPNPAPSEGGHSARKSEGGQSARKANSVKGDNENADDSGSKCSTPGAVSIDEGDDEQTGWEAPDVSDVEERFSVISAATSSVLAQQVEALAMSLLCVAHLALAKPKLGLSAQQNQENKQEMLDELQSLRHWITHKTMPPRWDPNKLTTMALQVTHQAAARGTSRRPEKDGKKSGKPPSPEPSGDDVMLRDSSKRKLVENGQKKPEIPNRRSLPLGRLMQKSASGDLDPESLTWSSEALDTRRIGGYPGGVGEVIAKNATSLPQPKLQGGLLSARSRNPKTDRVELTGLTALPPLTINGPQSAR